MSGGLVEFLGGPLDGQVRELPLDWEGMPPASVPVTHAMEPEPGWYVADIQLAESVYIRRPSGRPIGPAWAYVLDGLKT